jgi:hypothetical protein
VVQAFTLRAASHGFMPFRGGLFVRVVGDVAHQIVVAASRPSGSARGAAIELGASLRFARVEAIVERALPEQPPSHATWTMAVREPAREHRIWNVDEAGDVVGNLELDAVVEWLEKHGSLEALDHALNPSSPPPAGLLVGVGAGPHAWHRGLVAAHLLGRDLAWLKEMRRDQARQLPRFVQADLPRLIALLEAEKK